MAQNHSHSFSGEDLLCIRGERTVFAGLEFSARAGDALVLTGPNGSGKSSLLRLMAGLLQPAAGTLRRDGVAVGDDPEGHRESLHYVSHQDAVKPVLSVAENLSFWAAVHGGPENVEAALEAFGLSPLADTAARLLSAGQRRRLNLARVAASPAMLWLLDEPATALDAASVAAMLALVADHRAQGGIAVLSTHTDLGIDGAATLALDDFAPPLDFSP
jgi:heme exporter protein A